MPQKSTRNAHGSGTIRLQNGDDIKAASKMVPKKGKGHLKGQMPFLNMQKSPETLMFRDFVMWCRRWDLNPHDIAANGF